jgi:CHAT domain-containing protein
MTPVVQDKGSLDEILPELTRLENDTDRQAFLSSHPGLVRARVVEDLAALVDKKLRLDPKETLRIAEALVLIARELGSDEGVALAMRAKGNALYVCGESSAAVEHHQEAYRIYASRGSWLQAARTLSCSIQPLILLSEYTRAFDVSNQAKEIFTRLGEGKRLATLENNVGNIFHRQDRHAEALVHYERSYKALTEYQDLEHAAVALSNMAMCLIGLNDFSRALDCYQKARELWVKYNMVRCRDQVDYNIAYLYYLRGEYSRAIEMLLAARRACEESGDGYHVALCHLDLSEIYLELNLSEEAQQIAHEGFLRFQKLSITYEAAKALANEAIAYGQLGQASQALALFAESREMFIREQNPVWPSLLDLYQGLLLLQQQRHREAQCLGERAAQYFDESGLFGKAVLAHLLLARIALELGDLAGAEREGNQAKTELSRVQTPVLVFETYFLCGEIASSRGDRSAACEAYQRAREALETLRMHLHGEELKISFVKNRVQVYEALVDLHLDGPDAGVSVTDALACMEGAKSHSMTAMMFRSSQSLPVDEASESKEVAKVRELREELNWLYHRIELEQLRREGASRESVDRLRQQAQEREKELLRALRELPGNEYENVTFDAPAEFSIASLQATLPANATLIEYYSVGDRLVAALVKRETIEITPVSLVSRVSGLLQLLRFQLSRFRMGRGRMQQFEQPLLLATLSHLEDLYVELVKPLVPRLRAQHLVFVPHGTLHFLPFHALRTDDEYLGDAYTISYAPSATVFALCQQKAAAERPKSLVLGIPDERAPQIVTEVQSVAAMLPEAELYLGEQATSKVLREKGPDVGLVHIATHGIYRQDNPMFSGIRLGDGYVNLCDLYQLRLNAKLVTLSGCATGMNVVAAGDELLGLQRGLFRAGATSLLLSLWDVHDRSTSELMQEFYKSYIQSDDAALSLRTAMQNLRREAPHPYFWAPFVLVGKVADQQSVRSGCSEPVARPK